LIKTIKINQYYIDLLYLTPKIPIFVLKLTIFCINFIFYHNQTVRQEFIKIFASIKIFFKKTKKVQKLPVDKSVDKSAFSVDKSAKPVDKVIHRKKLSTGKPTYPHFIHRVIHRQKSCNLLILNLKKKLSTENALPNNYNLLNIYKKIIVEDRENRAAQTLDNFL